MIYHFENCVLDIERRELRRSGALLAIEPQVFDLLEYLIRNRERVISRDEIFAAVWHGRIVSDAVLSTRINAVRRAIGDSGAEERLIRTYRRKGLRFVGTAREEKHIPKGSSQYITSRQPLAFTLKDAPAITVHPFANLGGGLAGEEFADGLAEEIATALSKLGWLFIISRHSSFAHRGKAPHLKNLAPAFGVQYSLQGNVRQLRDGNRITVQLVDDATGQHLWAERFNRDLADSFAARDAIAHRVVSIIGDQIFAAENARGKIKASDNLGVWECIVRALSLMNSRKRQAVGAAQALLQQAIAIDPKSSAAFSLLSYTHTLGVHLGWHSRKATLPIAIHTAQKALSLNSDEPWAHVALGYATLQICNQPEQAIEHLEYALQLDPNLAISHYLIALGSAYAGRCEDAFWHADMSENLASLDLLTRGNSGAYDNVRATTCFVAGRFDEGIHFARKAIIQSPMLIPAYRQLVTNCSFAGNIEGAKAALKTIKQASPGIQRWIRESSSTWSRGDDYKKYVEAFRLAGL